MIDLKEIAVEIRDILEKKREELGLSFIEEDHIYYMKNLDGVVRDDFPSVSKVLKKLSKTLDYVPGLLDYPVF